MAAIGLLNELEVVKTVDFGVYLDGEEHGEILMPKRYVPENCQVGDQVEVFIYLDSEDRLVAVTDKPFCNGRRICQIESIVIYPYWCLFRLGTS